jgi:hypothetical protein
LHALLECRRSFFVSATTPQTIGMYQRLFCFSDSKIENL